MAISENGLNYDEQGFLVGKKAFNNQHYHTSDYLKEILKLIKDENTKFSTIKHENLRRDIHFSISENQGKSHALSGTNQSIQNESIQIIDLTEHVYTPKQSNTKDSKQIALDHQLEAFTLDISTTSKHSQKNAVEKKERLKDVSKSINSVNTISAQASQPLKGFAKTRKKLEPIPREQRTFNEKVEALLNSLEKSQSSKLTFKQIATAIPLVAISISGAVTLAIKKWWEDKTGKTSINTLNQQKESNTDLTQPQSTQIIGENSNKSGVQAKETNKPNKLYQEDHNSLNTSLKTNIENNSNESDSFNDAKHNKSGITTTKDRAITLDNIDLSKNNVIHATAVDQKNSTNTITQNLSNVDQDQILATDKQDIPNAYLNPLGKVNNIAEKTNVNQPNTFVFANNQSLNASHETAVNQNIFDNSNQLNTLVSEKNNYLSTNSIQLNELSKNFKNTQRFIQIDSTENMPSESKPQLITVKNNQAESTPIPIDRNLVHAIFSEELTG